MDQRIGRRERRTGKVLSMPKKDGMGADRHHEVIYGTVHLGGGFFYLLPPGHASVPDHDALKAEAQQALKTEAAAAVAQAEAVAKADVPAADVAPPAKKGK